ALAPRGGAGGEPDERGVQRVELVRGPPVAIEPREGEIGALTALQDGVTGAGRRVGPRPGEAAVQLHLAHDLGDLRGREVAGERDQAPAGGEEPEGRSEE